MNKLYQQTLHSARALEAFVEWTSSRSEEFEGTGVEMKMFFMNLVNSHLTASRDRKIHHLFKALANLDNVEKEILISGTSEEVIRAEWIIDRIQSLQKRLIESIRCLTWFEEQPRERSLS